MDKQTRKERLIRQLEQVEDDELINEIQAKLDEALGKKTSYESTFMNKASKNVKSKDFFAFAGMWSDRDINGQELRKQAWRREQ